MGDFSSLMEHSEIARSWSAEVQETYRAFYQRLSAHRPLTVKIGKGGLSFYTERESSAVFVCHFNAEPRKGQRELGFADFRYDALPEHLPSEIVIQSFQASAPPDVHIKVNKLWCSLHFPLASKDQVADLFLEHIIKKIS